MKPKINSRNMTLRNIFTAAIITLASLPAFAKIENHLVCYQDGREVVEDNPLDVVIDVVNNTAFTAFQCDINIPDYLHFVSRDGKYITRGERLTESHQVIETLIDDCKLRVLVYSTSNEPLGADPSSLFIYSVAANNPNLDSEGKTSITNIVFSEVADKGTSVECIEHPFKDLEISSAVTSLDEIGIDKLTIYAQGSNIIILAPASTTLQLTNVAGITTPLHVKAGKNVIPIGTPGVYIVNDTKVVVE